ncbi:MAG: prevent-host-death family protein [Candidatus Accumulibacter regalis]|jgi:prevent-host-death family protein|uniref:type II toxin-antitoxin system Phd/YefM family antitoxin n=1 Tax=unclassified Candidatus Accumulibacter TaxID=2619054 RepID=UPI0012CB6D15|nr:MULTISPECIES: type II toxin-antitoxin system prevent-host-death family antitoxin [unclassified Candidatus Accumulibacter]MBN8516053.1 type II toxin-antitoxin system prevent-host-death family antitoxin [Accumulibacter sp.]MBO3701106.1 type II toxin-antitoxin system prevent-host-death family antitoxin [Accumulibacter sp.]MQM35845.1 prevent-host-death protein [Candidatus Accumulibacter phosphatis]HRI91390.1 type II toxin-antitoxin system prevent-host-death family antitoxin [Accumulibacter sp.]
MQVNMLEAKNQLSKLVQAALAGEDVVIANNGVPVVRLVKVGAPEVARQPGAWAALPPAEADWDAPATNAAIADELTGGGIS